MAQCQKLKTSKKVNLYLETFKKTKFVHIHAYKTSDTYNTTSPCISPHYVIVSCLLRTGYTPHKLPPLVVPSRCVYPVGPLLGSVHRLGLPVVSRWGVLQRPCAGCRDVGTAWVPLLRVGVCSVCCSCLFLRCVVSVVSVVLCVLYVCWLEVSSL